MSIDAKDFPWEEVVEKWHWLAMDMDGVWHLFSTKPNMGSASYWCQYNSDNGYQKFFHEVADRVAHIFGQF